MRLKFSWVMIIWAITSGIALFFVLQNVIHPQVQQNSGIDRLKYPLDTRVRYRIGTVDARFGLSREDVKQLSDEAVQIWHQGTNQQWFVYDDNAKLSINLIYDERQAHSIARQKAHADIEQLIDNHNQHFDQLQIHRQKLHQEFETLQNELNTWQHNYNQLQQQINRTDHADQYHHLITQRNKLLEQKQRLDQKVYAYQRKQSDFNQTIQQYNQHSQTITHTINDTNQKFAPRQFHKGVFDGEIINIYEFQSKDDLRLTLAHELGHALGIGHNDDPTALMYPYAQSQNLQNFQLKPADIALLDSR